MSDRQQKSNVTFRGRHSALMRDVAEALESLGIREPRILSFGCSNGAECLDLLDVIPQSTVYGCDIDAKALAAAREACEGVATILESGSAELREAGPFDAVLALNVFCRHPKAAGLDDVSAVYPFASFESGLTQADSHVRPGGVFVLYNGQYFFEDAAVSRAYRGYPGGAHEMNGWIEKALPDGRRITDVPFSFEGQTYTRHEKSAFLKDPVMQKRVLASSVGGRYWHEWLDPSQSEGRSTRDAIWIKQE